MADSQIQWMYEGTKSAVNREDYLLGKKIDKNFELYSDAVKKEKETGIEAIEKLSRTRTVEPSTSAVVSNLEVDIVRREDPLVAIKVKQERISQEKMENPLTVLKMRKLLKKEMKRKERRQKKIWKKMMKKKAKKERKKTKSSSNGKDEMSPKQGMTDEKGLIIASKAGTSGKKDHKKEEKSELTRGPYIPEHLRQKYIDDSEESTRGSEITRGEGLIDDKLNHKFGLVDENRDHRRKSRSPRENPYKHLLKKRGAEAYKRPERRKLEAEDLEAKRRKMFENADWREKLRDENIRKAAELEKNEKQGTQERITNVIKPTMTMEERLTSQRKRLQSTRRFTDDKFLRR